MKLIVILFFIFGLCTALYLFITYFFIHKKDLKKINWLALSISTFIGLVLVTLVGIAIYKGHNSTDSWCTTAHATTSFPPANLVTAMDYFEKGNYNYDKGDCKQAILDYSESIKRNSKYPQSYNNRAYTYMRMMEYDLALADLDKALTLNPNYLHALRNRADVNNYKNNKESAILDYEKIMELAGPSTDVCAHLADAKNTSKSPLSFISNIKFILNCKKGKN